VTIRGLGVSGTLFFCNDLCLHNYKEARKRMNMKAAAVLAQTLVQTLVTPVDSQAAEDELDEDNDVLAAAEPVENGDAEDGRWTLQYSVLRPAAGWQACALKEQKMDNSGQLESRRKAARAAEKEFGELEAQGVKARAAVVLQVTLGFHPIAAAAIVRILPNDCALFIDAMVARAPATDEPSGEAAAFMSRCRDFLESHCKLCFVRRRDDPTGLNVMASQSLRRAATQIQGELPPILQRC
jgi:hypothetical protein